MSPYVTLARPSRAARSRASLVMNERNSLVQRCMASTDSSVIASWSPPIARRMTYLTEEAGRSEEEGGVFGGAASAESVEGAVDIVARVSVAQVDVCPVTRKAKSILGMH